MTEHVQTDLQARLIAKAWKDEAFKQALVNDPKGAIQQELGTEIPDGVQIQVHEQTEKNLHLVLPPKPVEDELSDADLETAAGGGIVFLPTGGFRPRRQVTS